MYHDRVHSKRRLGLEWLDKLGLRADVDDGFNEQRDAITPLRFCDPGDATSIWFVKQPSTGSQQQSVWITIYQSKRGDSITGLLGIYARIQ